MISKDIQPELWAYMAGICRNHGLVPIAINGTDNHCHVLFHLPTTIEASKAVQVIKANSSRWMSQRKKGFAWQVGGGVFGVSVSNTPAVIRYIRNQEEHHRTITYEEEYRSFLKGYRVAFDERYVWD